MSNVRPRYLLILGKVALCRNGLLQSHHRDCQLLHTSDFYQEERGAFEDANSEDQEGQTRSSSHQQFHRNTYERKRTNYQRDRAKHSNGKIEPFLSQSLSHYERLEIGPQSDMADIKSAYYKLSKQYHPDIVGKHDPSAAEHFRLITESYDILSDPRARAEYDKTLMSTQQTPVQSWQPSGFPKKEQDHIHRMREAGRIIKNKQDDFFEREKMKNPQKFRAGSFRVEPRDDTKEELFRLNRHIMSLSENHSDFQNSTSKGSTNYYRVHLAESIRRRRDDLREYQSLQFRDSTDDSALIASILTLFGGSVLVVLLGINMIYDFDLAEMLDRQFERFGAVKKEE